MKNLLNKVSANLNKKKLFCLFLALIIIFMAVIFCFSAQTAAESGKLVTSVRETNKEIMQNVLEKVGYKDIPWLINWVNNRVRKFAHAILFAALGLSLCGAAICLDPIKKFWQKPVWAILVGGLYGVTDELHQLFVKGRSSEVLDVFIDLGGIAAGILIMLIGYGIFRAIKNKKQKKENKASL